MLVPKPKKAFQSPGTQSFGRVRVAVVMVRLERGLAKEAKGAKKKGEAWDFVSFADFARHQEGESAVRILSEWETQPKIPVCALIIARPAA